MIGIWSRFGVGGRLKVWVRFRVGFRVRIGVKPTVKG